MRICVLPFFFLCSLPSVAQRCIRVMDMEIYQPIAGAVVYTETGKRYVTDSRGRVCISQTFSSITVSHKGHFPLTLNSAQVGDTIRLLPRDVTLNEVVITAKAPTASQQIFQSVRENTIHYGNPPSGHDFLKVFQRNKVRRKIREKARKAIENY